MRSLGSPRKSLDFGLRCTKSTSVTSHVVLDYPSSTTHKQLNKIKKEKDRKVSYLILLLHDDGVNKEAIDIQIKDSR